MKTAWLAAAVALMLFAAGCGQKAAPPDKAQDEPLAPAGDAGEKPAPPPDLTRITTDVKAKTVTVEGRFCLGEGILDYLAVVATGHEYESVLALNGKASRLHAALLAVGGTPGPTDDVLERMKARASEGGKAPEQAGSKFRAVVEWEADGKKVSVPASQLIVSRKTQKPPDDAPWVFTGSYFAKDPDTGKDLYMGDVDQALIGVFYAPSAVMNFTVDTGNPYDGMDTGYAVNKDLVPKPGTACKFILTPWDAAK